MKQRLGMAIISILALAAWAGAVQASPARLGSIKEKIKNPTRIAMNAQGDLYVSNTSQDSVRIYDRGGRYLKSLYVPGPLGVTVDAAGGIYVCSDTTRRIEIYNSDLTFSRVFSTDITTNSITIDKDGRIYVVDSRKDLVRVYDASGAQLFTFGSTGVVDLSDGRFNNPQSLAINEDLGELYVTDQQLITTTDGKINGARIQVFTKNGAYKRAFGVFGYNVGQIGNPAAIAVEKTGKLLVVDSGQGAVHILDPQTGAQSGALYESLVLPRGIAVGPDNIAWVTSYGGNSVEQYALDGYVTMAAAPAALSYTGAQLGAAPATQSIVIANAGSGALTWTATPDQTWLTVNGAAASSITGTTGPGSTTSLAIGVVHTTLASGKTYTGTITLASDFGQKNAVTISLTVTPPPTLTTSSNWLTYSAKKGKTAAPQTVQVTLANAATLPWSTTLTNLPWAVITPQAGAGTSEVTVTINTAGLNATPPGQPYTGTITFTTPSGSFNFAGPITVLLDIQASNKLSVLTNQAEAHFTLTGPAPTVYTGMGNWSVENAPAGDYRIAYDPLPGYRKPLPLTQTQTADNEITFTGTYVSWKALSARKNLITAKGPGVKNDALIKTYKADGTAVTPDLSALDSRYGANITSGDIDGDGTAEIIAGSGAGPENTTVVRIFKADKTILTEFTPYPGMKGGVHVLAADFDSDGSAEVAVAPAGGAENPGKVKIYSYNKDKNKMAATGAEIIAQSGLSGVNLAAADLAGNFAPALVTAPVSGTDTEAGSVKLWKVDTTRGLGSWSIDPAPVMEIPLQNKNGATVAAGDTDGDGRDELILGVSPDKTTDASGSLVKIYKADGAEATRFTVFDNKYGANVVAADLDGDGTVEIIVGLGPDPGAAAAADDREERKNKNAKQKADPSTLRVYSAAGVLKYAMTPYEDPTYGVTVVVGELGL
jgi:sugar lactone lactonase YvrE